MDSFHGDTALVVMASVRFFHLWDQIVCNIQDIVSVFDIHLA